VPLKTYDESLDILRRSLAAARLGSQEKVHGFKRLDALTRAVEKEFHPLANFQKALAHERSISPSIGGRTVFDDKKSARQQVVAVQGSLFS